MQILSRVPNFDFMKYRSPWLKFSIISSLLAMVLMVAPGFKFGVDFTGGTLIELKYAQAVQPEAVRDTLRQAGYHEVVAQYFGTQSDILLRLPPSSGASSAEISNNILQTLQRSDTQVQMKRVEFVGPRVGQELTENGLLALIFALVGILIYIFLRFEWHMAVAAVVATLHDAILTAGAFVLTGLDFDLTVLAALLTGVGYSVNDTIVIFDRIRENFRKMRSADTITVINASVNQTLARSIMTHVTVALVLVALWVFGGELNRPFAITMLFGVVIGTYSSIYIASPVANLLGIDRKALMPVVKEGAEQGH